MKEDGVSLNAPQLALAAEVAKRNGKTLGDKNWGERTVVAHVSEFLLLSRIQNEHYRSPAREVF
jgi:hypothetical protein